MPFEPNEDFGEALEALDVECLIYKRDGDMVRIDGDAVKEILGL